MQRRQQTRPGRTEKSAKSDNAPLASSLPVPARQVHCHRRPTRHPHTAGCIHHQRAVVTRNREAQLVGGSAEKRKVERRRDATPLSARSASKQ